MRQVTKLGTMRDMPRRGEMRRMVCEGTALCVANVRGKLRAIDDDCPHKGVSLSEGKLSGKSVVCPKHEWCFRAKSGKCKQHPEYQARVYRLFQLGEDVLVQL